MREVSVLVKIRDASEMLITKNQVEPIAACLLSRPIWSSSSHGHHHLALAPIAQADPPLMPFRDAGLQPSRLWDYRPGCGIMVSGVQRKQGFCALTRNLTSRNMKDTNE